MSTSPPDFNAPLEMLRKIYAEANSSNEKNMQQKLDAQKAWLNRNKFESEAFFNSLKQLLAAKLQLDLLKEQLLEAARLAGFANLETALNQVQNKEGQSPLQYALQQQSFALAKRLMDFGAIAGPEERAVFEVALDSDAAREFGLSTPFDEKPLHTVKNFGLVLGIQMTSQDGTSSQYAHIAPTYQLMTDSIADYSRTNPGNKEFEAISAAFAFSNKVADFSYSTSQRNPQAGEDMADRIQRGQITTIPVGCKGHVMGLSVVPEGPGSNSGYLVFTNRGLGAKPGEEGTQIYRIDDLTKVTPSFINSVMNGLGNDTSHADLMSQVHKVTGGKQPIHTIEQSAQKHDNCTIANTRSNIEGILLCQKANSKNGFDKLNINDLSSVKAEYKKYTGAMRANKVNELVKALEKDPHEPDLNNLAKEYLKQHPHADASLRAPLEKALGLQVSPQASEEYQRAPKM